MKVLTTKGLLERADLTVKDIVSESDNARTVATEYYLGEELVKRSVWIDAWRPLDLGAT
jgi:hypothetical protein